MAVEYFDCDRSVADAGVFDAEHAIKTVVIGIDFGRGVRGNIEDENNII